LRYLRRDRFTRPGSIAEKIFVPTGSIHRLEPTVQLDDAVLVEPMAVVWRALNRMPLRRGLRVAVVGDGTVAILAAYMVRLFEPAKVVVVGRRAAQEELVLKAGVDEFVTSPPSTRLDLVIEAAGNADAV
jgi:threonine dehydrogenase-like Zn-dependent dehydrogenase